jgi:hypothetical protein
VSSLNIGFVIHSISLLPQKSIALARQTARADQIAAGFSVFLLHPPNAWLLSMSKHASRVVFSVTLFAPTAPPAIPPASYLSPFIANPCQQQKDAALQPPPPLRLCQKKTTPPAGADL